MLLDNMEFIPSISVGIKRNFTQKHISKNINYMVHDTGEGKMFTLLVFCAKFKLTNMC
jgi:hypothetical protein